MELFHYTNKTPAETIVLDPAKYFGSNSFSKREKAAASTPRTFFYTDPSQREVWFDNSKDLFSVTMDDSKIYNLKQDHLQLKQQADKGTFVDMDKLFSLIISAGYLGASYKNAQFEGVILFTPVLATKVPDELRKALEFKP